MRPPLKRISSLRACPMHMVMAPSTCWRAPSGLTTRPTSTASRKRSVLTFPVVLSTATWATATTRPWRQAPHLWLRTTDYGDDKDRVMRKSDGTYTYFVPDVAYHLAKFERGFHQAINIQGADHHGTIARVRAGL